MKALLIIAGLALIFLVIVAVVAGGAHLIDRSENKARLNKKQVAAMQNTLGNIEQYARDQLAMHNGDLMAHFVIDEVNKMRRKALN